MTNQTFIFVIDEWDCIFREKKMDKKAQEIYLDYLRMMLKGKNYVSLVYMTGILPIKKYGTHSALNMFDEFSMLSPKQFTPFVGFTEKEVHDICDAYHVPFDKMKTWYDGYHLNDMVSIYSPRSVIAAALSGSFENYWN